MIGMTYTSSKQTVRRNSHPVPPIDDLILVASYLKALSFLLVADNSNICQPLLSCVTANPSNPLQVEQNEHWALHSRNEQIDSLRKLTDWLLHAL
jgi:hypothetical protein